MFPEDKSLYFDIQGDSQGETHRDVQRTSKPVGFSFTFLHGLGDTECSHF